MSASLVHCGPDYAPYAVLPVAATSSMNVTTSAAFALPLPPTTTLTSGTLNFPAPTSGPSSSFFSIVVQPTAPSSVPPLAGVSVSSARRTVQSVSANLEAAIIITSSLAFVFPNGPTFSLVLPPADISAGESYELAYFDPVAQQWDSTWEGPGTLSGTTLTFAANGVPFMLQANTPTVFELIGSNSSGASAAVSVNPGSVALVIGGTPTTQNITVSQAGLAPTFTPTLTCTPGSNSPAGNVATIAAVGTATASSAGGSVTFAVSVASSSPVAGTCTGSIASSAGGTAATFSVSVTTTNLSLQSQARQ